MSFTFTGSACNMGSYISLTNNNNGNYGQANLTGLDKTSNFTTRFTVSNNTGGYTEYHYDNYLVSISQVNSNLALYFNGSLLASSNFVHTGNEQVVVKHRTSSSNASTQIFVNSTSPILNYIGSNYSISTANHYWYGYNSSGLEKRLYNPIVQSINTIQNSAQIQGSLLVTSQVTASTISCSNIVVDNVIANNYGVTLTTSGGATLGAMNINSMGFSGAYYCGLNHYSQSSSQSTYNVLCGSTGDLFLNSAPSKRIYFRNSNSDCALLETDGTFKTLCGLSNSGLLFSSNAVVSGSMSVSQNLGVTGNVYSSGLQTTYGASIGTELTCGSMTVNSKSPFNSSRCFSITYYNPGTYSIGSSYTLPLVVRLPNVMAQYVSSLSCLGSVFSGYNTSSSQPIAPVAGMYTYTYYVSSTNMDMYVNGQQLASGMSITGSAYLNAGDTFYPYSITYTTGNLPPSGTNASKIMYNWTLVRETL